MRWLGPLLAGVLMGAVVGFAASRFVGGDATRDASSDPLAHAASSRSSSSLTGSSGSDSRSGAGDANSTTSSSSAAVEPSRSAETSAPSSAPSEVVARVAAAVRASPPPNVRKGGKSIQGRVVDGDGKPVEGAVLRADREGGEAETAATPERSTTGAAAPSSESLDAAVREAVQKWYDGRADRRETKSDADGRYRFDDLRDGRWNVQAWREGFELVARSANHDSAVTPDATLDFSAKAVLHATVTVKLPDGSVAPKAALEVKRAHSSNGESDRTELWTREQPTLPPLAGEWQVRATLGDPDVGPEWKDVLVSERQTTTIEAAASAPPSLTFQLHGCPGIRGKVKFPDGKKTTVSVNFQPVKPGAEPDLDALAQNDGRGVRMYRNFRNYRRWNSNELEDGATFCFKDLAPGRYVVGAARGWRGRVVAHAVVEVSDSMVVQDLEMPSCDPNATLLVRVTDAAGQPVDDVDFSAEVEHEHGSSSSGVEADREDEGAYRLRLDQFDDSVDLAKNWPGGVKVHLHVSSEACGQKTVDLTGPTHTLDVQFQKPASLLATVQHYVGSGYEGRLSLTVVRAADEEDSRSGRQFMRNAFESGLAEDGTQSFEALEPGPVKLELTLTERSNHRGWSAHVVASVALTLVAGDNSASVAIPALYSLAIEMKDGAKGQLRLRAADANERDWSNMHQGELDEHARATFDDLPAGEYVVEHYDDERQSMRVHVPTSGPVRFQPMAVNALQVFVRGSEGALAKAGFKSEDEIVAIDGKEFASQAELKELMDAAMKKDEAVFAVLRGKERVELTFDPKLLQNPVGLGGTVWPTTR